jgi:parallel beta-helix repeat protein
MMKFLRYRALTCALLFAALGACDGSAALPARVAGASAQTSTTTEPVGAPARATPASPCESAGSGAPATPAPAPTNDDEALDVRYDDDTDTIVLRSGSAPSLDAVRQALGRPEALRELSPGEWLLNANLRVERKASLRIVAPEAHMLKLRSGEDGFVWLKVAGGKLELDGVCVSSWDTARDRSDENYADGRSFVLARAGARMTISRSELRYLGYDANESYGLAWRLAGTRGSIVDSILAYNYYGLYSYEASDLVIRGNEVHHSVRYGIDPHTRSNRLLIEGNISHDNGKHGIILAEDCNDSVIRNNIVYGNTLHGIVIYQHSDNNLVEGNQSYGNREQGININNASDNELRNNTLHSNGEDGIGVGQGARRNLAAGNEVRANGRDGIAIYSDATETTLRGNTVSANKRWGISVKSAGNERIEENRIFDNLVGIFFKGAPAPQALQQANQIHDNAEADVRSEGQ